MICILAGNYQEALTYAKGQFLEPNEWFYPHNPDELKLKTNFHVLVVGTAGQNVHPSYFEYVFRLAKKQGRIGR